MLDQDTARALLTIADETGARVALVGDRHQLPAVGRGGVLDHAVAWAHPTRRRDAGDGAPVHRPRLRRPQPADAHRRRPGEVFDALHRTRSDRRSTPPRSSAPQPSPKPARPATWSSPTPANRSPTSTPPSATSAPTPTTRRGPTDGHDRARRADRGRRPGRDPPQRPRPRRSRTGRPGPSPASATTAASILHGHGRDREIPAEYATRFVELAYATTVHGAQGETVDRAHVAIGEHTGAAAAYVAMTRGRARQHRPPRRRDPRGRPPAVDRGVRPRPRRPRTRPRPATAPSTRSTGTARPPHHLQPPRLPAPRYPAAHLAALRNRPLTSRSSPRVGGTC